MLKERLRSLKRIARRGATQAVWRALMPPSGRQGRTPFGVEELKLLRQALQSQTLSCIDGALVPQFETEFAALHDLPYGVASTSGTAAIHVALGGLDLEPGDEVITAPITDLGTVIPIIAQGAIPIFADVDRTLNMDPADVERRITPRTRALIVVHLFGNPCDMDAMRAIASRHRLALIEDCSQAHLAEYKGRLVGAIGDIGCFSFQQSKHMTTGDGGMTITADAARHERMKLFVDKGYARKGYGPRAYLFHAPNYRMTELVAAVGLAQLGKLRGVVERRRALAARLDGLLQGVEGLTAAPVTEGARSSYWVYPLIMDDRAAAERVAARLRDMGVYASAGYIGKPIYVCSESLSAKKTYGRSQWPFTIHPDVTYDYGEGLCPKAEEVLPRLVVVPVDESWDMGRVERAAAVIREAAANPAAPGGGTRHPAAVPAARATESVAPAAARPSAPRARIAIVGCGQMGRWHAQSYRQNPRVELVAFADSQIGLAQALARETGGRAYASHRDLIANETVDGVSVCTVPASHHRIVLDFLAAGAHVLCEKPLAVSADEAREMAAAAAARDRHLLAAFKFRFFDEVRKAHELIASGALGRLLGGHLVFAGRLDAAAGWVGQPQLSGGGVVMDNGPHAVDLIRHLFGEIEEIGATTASVQGAAVEDTAQLICRVAGGARVSIDLSWSVAVPPRTYLEIYGEQGVAALDLEGISYKLAGWTDWKRAANAASTNQAFVRQIDHFVSAVLGATPGVVVSRDGVAAQAVIEAAYEAAGRQTPVSVELGVDSDPDTRGEAAVLVHGR